MTVPLPLPLLPAVTVSQVALLEAAQAQPLAVLTVTLPVPAPAVKDWLVGEMMKAQMTVVGSEAELLAGLASPEVATVAVLVTEGEAAPETATVSVIVLLAPAASEPELVQVTVPPRAEQFQPVPVPETKLKPIGRGSVTVIVPVLAADPTFLTVSV